MTNLKMMTEMKMKSASNYDRQVLLENTAGVLFALFLTAMFVLNIDSIVEVAKGLSFIK